MLFTYANIITILGILALFPLAYFLFTGIGLLVLILSIWIIVSDYIDGILARKFDQITKFGKILDPIRDRAFLAVFFIYFIFKTPDILTISLIISTILVEIISALIKGKILRKFSIIDHTLVGQFRMAIHSLAIIYFIINNYWLYLSWPNLPQILTVISLSSLFALVSHYGQLKKFNKQFKNN